MFWLYSGNLLFRVLVSLMFLMSEVFYVCFLSYFDPLAIVFVMMTLSFLLFFHQGREAKYSILHDSRCMVLRARGEVFQDQIVLLDGMVLHLFEYLLAEC